MQRQDLFQIRAGNQPEDPQARLPKVIVPPCLQHGIGLLAIEARLHEELQAILIEDFFPIGAERLAGQIYRLVRPGRECFRHPPACFVLLVQFKDQPLLDRLRAFAGGLQDHIGCGTRQGKVQASEAAIEQIFIGLTPGICDQRRVGLTRMQPAGKLAALKHTFELILASWLHTDIPADGACAFRGIVQVPLLRPGLAPAAIRKPLANRPSNELHIDLRIERLIRVEIDHGCFHAHIHVRQGAAVIQALGRAIIDRMQIVQLVNELWQRGILALHAIQMRAVRSNHGGERAPFVHRVDLILRKRCQLESRAKHSEGAQTEWGGFHGLNGVGVWTEMGRGVSERFLQPAKPLRRPLGHFEKGRRRRGIAEVPVFINVVDGPFPHGCV